MISIKKIYFVLISLLIFSIVSCKAQESINKVKPLSISIATNIDTYSLHMSSVRGITLIPQLEGDTDKDIQYHWSIDSDTEMFKSLDGTQREIINSGESVLFVPVAQIGYSEADTLSNTIKVTLEIEEEGSNKVLTKTDLIIEDYAGIYKVKK